MRSTEFISELDNRFVNSQVDTSSWKQLGQGCTASVWQHINDPDTVVKLVGGGYDSVTQEEKSATIAFVKFCVDHGYESKHFPIIHGINVDDPEVIQIRLEGLLPFNGDLGYALEMISPNLIKGRKAYVVSSLTEALYYTSKAIQQNNTAESLVSAVEMLLRYVPVYSKIFKCRNLKVDLHAENWMRRSDGTIVAVDPWYGFK